jgi:hypothetical protein
MEVEGLVINFNGCDHRHFKFHKSLKKKMFLEDLLFIPTTRPIELKNHMSGAKAFAEINLSCKLYVVDPVFQAVEGKYSSREPFAPGFRRMHDVIWTQEMKVSCFGPPWTLRTDHRYLLNGVVFFCF